MKVSLKKTMNNHQENIKNLNEFFDDLSNRILSLQNYVKSVSDMINHKDPQSEVNEHNQSLESAVTDHSQDISEFPGIVKEKTKDVTDFVDSFDFDSLDLSGMEL